MKRCWHQIFRAGILLVAIVITACIPRPEDPVSIGTLCLPSGSDCPDEAVLVRDSVGRNQLDYAITNNTDAMIDIDAFVVNPSILDFDPTNFETDDVIAQRTFRAVAPGATVSDRFTPLSLGTRDSVRFVPYCDSCEISVEYVFESVPLECFDDEDCSSGWLCDQQFGQCAECITNDDCNEDQTCDSFRGRCTPEDTTPNCATSGTFPVIFFLLLTGLFLSRRTWRAIVVPAALICLFIPIELGASPPSANMTIGVGYRELFGTLGEDAQAGIGMTLSQELRWRYIGAAVAIGTTFYQTTQDPPPFTRGLQTYTAQIGPRIYIPLGSFGFHVGPDIRRVGFMNNSLVRVTGVKNNFTAIGGNAGFRFHFDRILLRLDGGFAPFLNLPGSTFSLEFSVGLGASR